MFAHIAVMYLQNLSILFRFIQQPEVWTDIAQPHSCQQLTWVGFNNTVQTSGPWQPGLPELLLRWWPSQIWHYFQHLCATLQKCVSCGTLPSYRQ